MDGVDRGRRWKSLKERLGFKGIGCCGATWGLMPSTISVRDDDDDQVPEQEEHEQVEAIDVGQAPPESIWDPGCVGQTPVASGMNLATALAAERQFRAAQETEAGAVEPTTNGGGDRSVFAAGTAPGTPWRVSLMRLLEETNGVDAEAEKEKGGGCDSMCCVCMARKKGAAFIPCGHTFCRVCSRELWLNRGCCPLCNRSILEILDIF